MLTVVSNTGLRNTFSGFGGMYMCTCTYISTGVCVHTSIHVCMYVHKYRCVYTYFYTCVYVRT